MSPEVCDLQPTEMPPLKAERLFALLGLLIPALGYSYYTSAFNHSLSPNLAITLSNLTPLWITACKKIPWKIKVNGIVILISGSQGQKLQRIFAM